MQAFLVLPLHATQQSLYQSTDNNVSETAGRLPSQGRQFPVSPVSEFTEKQVTENNVSPDHIINMDMVHLMFDIPMGQSVAEKFCEIHFKINTTWKIG